MQQTIEYPKTKAMICLSRVAGNGEGVNHRLEARLDGVPEEQVELYTGILQKYGYMVD